MSAFQELSLWNAFIATRRKSSSTSLERAWKRAARDAATSIRRKNLRTCWPGGADVKLPSLPAPRAAPNNTVFSGGGAGITVYPDRQGRDACMDGRKYVNLEMQMT